MEKHNEVTEKLKCSSEMIFFFCNVPSFREISKIHVECWKKILQKDYCLIIQEVIVELLTNNTKSIDNLPKINDRKNDKF